MAVLYVRLDGMREAAAQALADAAGAPTAGTPAARSEREAFVDLYARRVRQLQSVEQRLCFGRLDLAEGGIRYVGRIGISDDERQELLLDWRAPAAEPFYQATAATPRGVVRRRQITTRGRTVTGVSDEVLDAGRFAADGAGGSRVVIGEGALLASLESVRTGQMRDIVATIQADQDRVIRAPAEGVLVVQGGPGTGKTAVALHRAAFLLYDRRERLERSGVLVVGPNRRFLHYIDQVLPTLGEAEAVVMRTAGELYPGVVATAEEDAPLAVLKGDPRMADVLAEAVRRRQRVPDRPVRLDIDAAIVTLRPGDVRAAREHARREGSPHNEARTGFVREVLNRLVRQLAAARGVELDQQVRGELLEELRETPAVRREVNWCWAPITAERLLRDLFAVPKRLAEAGAGLSDEERRRLQRPRTAPWTVSDIALLDEAAQHLGAYPVPVGTERRDAGPTASEIEYARAVQATFGRSPVSAEELAQRYAGDSDLASVAERAAADRTWAFGHIVVDEAQELSAMTWRLLMRRCPSRSLTVVGDLAQTGSAAGATSWAEVLAPHVADRWRQAELTVNYRTPTQVMELAAAVLHANGSPVTPPSSARRGRFEPAWHRIAADAPDWAERLRAVLGAVLPSLVGGTAAVICPVGLRQPAQAALADLGETVPVLTVAEAKGLEFDAVVLLDPAGIGAGSARGPNDLYVALTRPTQQLHIVYSGALPAGLAEPAPAG
ncbi:MAG: AAA family ATPase [bacterium]